MKESVKIKLTILLVLAVACYFQLGRLDLFLGSLARAANTDQPDIEIKNVSLLRSDTNHYYRSQSLVIGDADGDKEIISNLRRVLGKLSIDTDFSEQKKRQNQPPNDYSRYDLIILTPSVLGLNSLSAQIQEYVEQGGRLLVLNKIEPEESLMAGLADLAGIVRTGEVKQTSIVYFQTELISGITGKLQLTGEVLSPHEYFHYQESELDSECQIALISEDGNPLIWQRQYLNGEVMVINTDHYASRYLTGLLAGSISALIGTVVYPVPAAKIIFIDDFPADYSYEIALIRKEYGRNYERFVQEIWWPLISGLLAKHALKPSCAYLPDFAEFDYISRDSRDHDKSPAFKLLLNDILAADGEVCLHGYNHQPLSCDTALMTSYGYKAWPDVKTISDSLRKASGILREIMPEYNLQVYIPPSDLLASADFCVLSGFSGLRQISGSPAIADILTAVATSVPSIKTVSGIYYPPPGKEMAAEGFMIHDSGVLAVQSIDPAYRDFASEVSGTTLIALPRITFGPNLSGEFRMLLASAAMTEGIISHTVFVDDILDPYRSRGRDCEQITAAYGQVFSMMDEDFPWLESMTASEAAVRIGSASQAHTWFSRTDSELEIYCANHVPGQKLIVRISGDLLPVNGCLAARIDSCRWLVSMEQESAILEVVP